jgi:ABC-type Na+ efflux pump permease subunit
MQSLEKKVKELKEKPSPQSLEKKVKEKPNPQSLEKKAKKPRKFQTPLNMVSEVYFFLVLIFFLYANRSNT